jgi:hypothetical protein
MTSDGSDVSEVLFRMDRPLNDPSVLYLSWDGETFSPFDLAALPAAQMVVLAPTSKEWGF